MTAFVELDRHMETILSALRLLAGTRQLLGAEKTSILAPQGLLFP